MSDRRDFERRPVLIRATLRSLEGDVIADPVDVVDVSLGGLRFCTDADVTDGGRYTLKFPTMDKPVGIELISSEDGTYRCRITLETNPQDLIQNDDFSILLLRATGSGVWSQDKKD